MIMIHIEVDRPFALDPFDYPWNSSLFLNNTLTVVLIPPSEAVSLIVSNDDESSSDRINPLYSAYYS
jgi:hypothetical protein